MVIGSPHHRLAAENAPASRDRAVSTGLCVGVIPILASLGACASPCDEHQPGVMLSFDDHSATWQEELDLFAAHDARVTFYVSGGFLQDTAETMNFVGPLHAAGHSLGVHTVHHLRAPEEYRNDPEAWLQDEVLLAKHTLEEATGFPVVAFAYPFGDVSDDATEELLGHFAFVRDFQHGTTVYADSELSSTPRLIQSTSIDNIRKRSRSYFRDRLDALEGSDCLVWPITSHHISDEDWGITPETLDWLLGEINARGLRTYVPDDFSAQPDPP